MLIENSNAMALAFKNQHTTADHEAIHLCYFD